MSFSTLTFHNFCEITYAPPTFPNGDDVECRSLLRQRCCLHWQLWFSSPQEDVTSEEGMEKRALKMEHDTHYYLKQENLFIFCMQFAGSKCQSTSLRTLAHQYFGYSES